MSRHLQLFLRVRELALGSNSVNEGPNESGLMEPCESANERSRIFPPDLEEGMSEGLPACATLDPLKQL